MNESNNNPNKDKHKDKKKDKNKDNKENSNKTENLSKRKSKITNISNEDFNSNTNDMEKNKYNEFTENEDNYEEDNNDQMLNNKESLMLLNNNPSIKKLNFNKQSTMGDLKHLDTLSDNSKNSTNLDKNNLFTSDDWFNFFLNNPNKEFMSCDYDFLFNKFTGYNVDREEHIINKACVICFKENCNLDEEKTDLPCKCFSRKQPFHDTFDLYDEFRNLGHVFSHLNYDILKLQDKLYYVNQKHLAYKIKILSLTGLDVKDLAILLVESLDNNKLNIYNNNNFFSYYDHFNSSAKNSAKVSINYNNANSFNNVHNRNPSNTSNNINNINNNNTTTSDNSLINNKSPSQSYMNISFSDKLIKNNIADAIIDNLLLSGNYSGLLSFINNKENHDKLYVMYMFYSVKENTYYLSSFTLNQNKKYIKNGNEFFKYLTTQGFSAIKDSDNFSFLVYYLYMRLVKPWNRYTFKYLTFVTMTNLSCLERYFIYQNPYCRDNFNLKKINDENMKFIESNDTQEDEEYEKIVEICKKYTDSNYTLDINEEIKQYYTNSQPKNDINDCHARDIIKNESIHLALQFLDFQIDYLISSEEDRYISYTLFLHLVKLFAKNNIINQELMSKIIKLISIFLQCKNFMDKERALLILKISFFYFLHVNDRVVFNRFKKIMSNNEKHSFFSSHYNSHDENESFDYSNTWAFDARNEINHHISKLFLTVLTQLKKDFKDTITSDTSIRRYILGMCCFTFMKNTNEENFYINCIKSSHSLVDFDKLMSKDNSIIIDINLEINAFKMVMELYEQYYISYEDFYNRISFIFEVIGKKASQTIIRNHNTNVLESEDIKSDCISENTDIFDDEIKFYELKINCREYVSCVFYNLLDVLFYQCLLHKKFLLSKEEYLVSKELIINEEEQNTINSENKENDDNSNNNSNNNNHSHSHHTKNDNNSKDNIYKLTPKDKNFLLYPLSKKTATIILRLFYYLASNEENFNILLSINSITFAEILITSNPMEFLRFFKDFNKLYFKKTSSRIVNNHSFMINIFDYLNKEYFTKLLLEKNYNLLLQFLTHVLSLVNRLLPLCTIKDELLIIFFKKVFTWIVRIKQDTELYSILKEFLICDKTNFYYLNHIFRAVVDGVKEKRHSKERKENNPDGYDDYDNNENNNDYNNYEDCDNSFKDNMQYKFKICKAIKPRVLTKFLTWLFKLYIDSILYDWMFLQIVDYNEHIIFDMNFIIKCQLHNHFPKLVFYIRKYALLLNLSPYLTLNNAEASLKRLYEHKEAKPGVFVMKQKNFHIRNLAMEVFLENFHDFKVDLENDPEVKELLKKNYDEYSPLLKEVRTNTVFELRIKYYIMCIKDFRNFISSVLALPVESQTKMIYYYLLDIVLLPGQTLINMAFSFIDKLTGSDLKQIHDMIMMILENCEFFYYELNTGEKLLKKESILMSSDNYKKGLTHSSTLDRNYKRRVSMTSGNYNDYSSFLSIGKNFYVKLKKAMPEKITDIKKRLKDTLHLYHIEMLEIFNELYNLVLEKDENAGNKNKNEKLRNEFNKENLNKEAFEKQDSIPTQGNKENENEVDKKKIKFIEEDIKESKTNDNNKENNDDNKENEDDKNNETYRNNDTDRNNEEDKLEDGDEENYNNNKSETSKKHKISLDIITGAEKINDKINSKMQRLNTKAIINKYSTIDQKPVKAKKDKKRKKDKREKGLLGRIGIKLLHNYLNDLEIAAQNQNISIIIHLIDNYNNDREYLITLISFIFTSIDRNFIKNSKIDEINKNKEIKKEDMNNIVSSMFRMSKDANFVSAYRKKLDKSDDSIIEVIEKIDEEKLRIMRKLLHEKANEFPYQYFNNQLNNVNLNLNFSNVSNICTLNALISHFPSLIQEFFVNNITENDYYKNFFTNIFSNFLYPTLIYGIYKQFNTMFIGTSDSLSRECFDLIIRSVDSLIDKKTSTLNEFFFSLNYNDMVFMHFYSKEQMEPLYEKRYSLFNLLCYFIIICLENIEALIRMTNYRCLPPEYMTYRLLEQNMFYIEKTMKVIIKLLGTEEIKKNKAYFEAPIPPFLKTNENNLKNNLILNFFPILNILDFYEVVLFNIDVPLLNGLKILIIDLLIELVERVKEPFIVDKIIFYLKTNNLYAASERALVSALNEINEINQYENIEINNEYLTNYYHNYHSNREVKKKDSFLINENALNNANNENNNDKENKDDNKSNKSKKTNNSHNTDNTNNTNESNAKKNQKKKKKVQSLDDSLYSTESNFENFDFNIDNLEKVDYEDFVKIIYATPKYLKLFYSNQNFQLFLKYNLLSSYITSYNDLSNETSKICQNYFFNEDKRRDLSNKELMMKVIKDDNINFGKTDNEENLSILISLIIYTAFERRVEFMVKDELVIKIFTLPIKDYIICYHKDKISSIRAIYRFNIKEYYKTFNEKKALVEFFNLRKSNDDDDDDEGLNINRKNTSNLKNTSFKYINTNNNFSTENISKKKSNSLKHEKEVVEDDERVDLLNSNNNNDNKNDNNTYQPQNQHSNKEPLLQKNNSNNINGILKTNSSIDINKAITHKQNSTEIKETKESKILNKYEIKISQKVPYIFNKNLFEKNLDLLCHPDVLSKFFTELWDFYKSKSMHNLEEPYKYKILNVFVNDLILGQKISHNIAFILILFFLFLVDDINNLSGFHQFFIILLSLLQCIALITNITVYAISRLYYCKFTIKQQLQKKEDLFFGYVSITRYSLNIISDCFSSLLFLLLSLSAIFFETKLVFIAVQIFWIYLFSDTIQSIYNAFLSKIEELASLVFILIITVLSFATLGFFWYHNEFNVTVAMTQLINYSSNYLSSSDNNYNDYNILNSNNAYNNYEKASLAYAENASLDNTMNICNSLISCVYFFFNFGLRSGGGIGDQLSVKTPGDSYYWIRLIMDMLFFIIIILLFLNMLNGIIINGFSTYREEMEKIEDNKINKCFICNLHKTYIEKNKVSYNRHIEIDHNPYNYFFYVDYLKTKGFHRLNNHEKSFVTSLRKQEITMLPLETCYKLKKRNNLI